MGLIVRLYGRNDVTEDSDESTALVLRLLLLEAGCKHRGPQHNGSAFTTPAGNHIEIRTEREEREAREHPIG